VINMFLPKGSAEEECLPQPLRALRGHGCLAGSRGQPGQVLLTRLSKHKQPSLLL